MIGRRQMLIASALTAAGCNVRAPSSPSPPHRAAIATTPATNFAMAPSYPPIAPLSDDVYLRRRERARQLTREAKADVLIATAGGASFAYLVGSDFGRSERLIAFVMSASSSILFAPSFEVSRVEQRVRAGLKVQGWEESQDPIAAIRDSPLLRGGGGGGGGGAVRILIEPHTEYGITAAIARAMPEAQLIDGSRAFEDLRAVKVDDEIVRMRRAIAITEDAFAATFALLDVGMREKDVAKIAREEHAKRGGVDGYALVQFGTSAAFPHGGPTAAALAKETVVLMDGGCTFQGWNSDVTRTRWFGEAPSDRFRAIYNLVHDAQTAAIARVKSGVAAQEIDRAAREVITRGGFGPQFTHRLGHGIGMEGHEAVYMVEGNLRPLEPGLVFTVEPGIYLPGELGVRIEDQVLCGKEGAEILTRRAPRL